MRATSASSFGFPRGDESQVEGADHRVALRRHRCRHGARHRAHTAPVVEHDQVAEGRGAHWFDEGAHPALIIGDREPLHVGRMLITCSAVATPMPTNMCSSSIGVSRRPSLSACGLDTYRPPQLFGVSATSHRDAAPAHAPCSPPRQERAGAPIRMLAHSLREPDTSRLAPAHQESGRWFGFGQHSSALCY